MKKMNEKKILQQVYTKLENQLEQEVKLADDSIEILDGDKVIFKIDSKGDMLYSADKQFSNIVNKLHGKIEGKSHGNHYDIHPGCFLKRKQHQH